MNRTLAIIGLACGVIVLMGFFAPWLELHSRSYRLGEERVKDHLKVTGWNLVQGRLEVIQVAEWGGDYMTTEIQVESKSYPYLVLAGGILLMLGGIGALTSKRKAPYLIVISGGVLAFVGGLLGFWVNRWITPRAIIIENYTVFGYYRYGLFLCTIGSLVSIAGCILEWDAGLWKEQRL